MPQTATRRGWTKPAVARSAPAPRVSHPKPPSHAGRCGRRGPCWCFPRGSCASSTSPVPAGTDESRMIAARTSQPPVACTLLRQAVGLTDRRPRSVNDAAPDRRPARPAVRAIRRDEAVRAAATWPHRKLDITFVPRPWTAPSRSLSTLCRPSTARMRTASGEDGRFSSRERRGDQGRCSLSPVVRPATSMRHV